MEPQLLVSPDGTRIAWRQAERTFRRDVARGLLQTLLEPEFGPVSFKQACAYCGQTDHGPLRVVTSASHHTPLVSVSYSGNVAVAAVAAADAIEFGIDAELDSAKTRTAVGEALSDRPDRSIRTWTVLEAIAKARGTGLRGDWQHADTTGFILEHHAIVDEESVGNTIIVTTATRVSPDESARRDPPHPA